MGALNGHHNNNAKVTSAPTLVAKVDVKPITETRISIVKCASFSSSMEGDIVPFNQKEITYYPTVGKLPWVVMLSLSLLGGQASREALHVTVENFLMTLPQMDCSNSGLKESISNAVKMLTKRGLLSGEASGAVDTGMDASHKTKTKRVSCVAFTRAGVAVAAVLSHNHAASSTPMAVVDDNTQSYRDLTTSSSQNDYRGIATSSNQNGDRNFATSSSQNDYRGIATSRSYNDLATSSSSQNGYRDLATSSNTACKSPLRSKPCLRAPSQETEAIDLCSDSDKDSKDCRDSGDIENDFHLSNCRVEVDLSTSSVSKSLFDTVMYASLNHTIPPLAKSSSSSFSGCAAHQEANPTHQIGASMSASVSHAPPRLSAVKVNVSQLSRTQWEVVLLVDKREQQHAAIQSKMLADRVPCELAVLAVGDFLWIARPTSSSPGASSLSQTTVGLSYRF